jgi:hypothetical protein
LPRRTAHFIRTCHIRHVEMPNFVIRTVIRDSPPIPTLMSSTAPDHSFSSNSEPHLEICGTLIPSTQPPFVLICDLIMNQISRSRSRPQISSNQPMYPLVDSRKRSPGAQHNCRVTKLGNFNHLSKSISPLSSFLN